MTEVISGYASGVDFAMAYITVISIVMLLLITIVMIVFVVKYHHKKHPNPKQTHGSTILETVWITIPTIIVVSMFYVAYADFADMRETGEYDEEIHVEVKSWQWFWTYGNGATAQSIIIKDLEKDKPSEFLIPVGKTIKFVLNGFEPDFIHSFYIPAFRLKEDIVPGKTTYMYATPEKIGTYILTCAEYCGLWHSRMYANVRVVEQSEYDSWLLANAPAIEELAEEEDDDSEDDMWGDDEDEETEDEE
jgi:cytochrome c oxidase subunit II